jgi:hypothetical protein
VTFFGNDIAQPIPSYYGLEIDASCIVESHGTPSLKEIVSYTSSHVASLSHIAVDELVTCTSCLMHVTSIRGGVCLYIKAGAGHVSSGLRILLYTQEFEHEAVDFIMKCFKQQHVEWHADDMVSAHESPPDDF